MGGSIDGDKLLKSAKISANPLNIFKGKDKRREFFHAASDPAGLAETPEAIDVPPPPPADDSAIVAAKEKQRQADLRRRGRRASILTSPQGLEDQLGTVNRPRSAQVLG